MLLRKTAARKFQAVAALTGIVFLNLLALPSVAQLDSHESTALTVIQGTITNIDGNTLTVKTPDIILTINKYRFLKLIISYLSTTASIRKSVIDS